VSNMNSLRSTVIIGALMMLLSGCQSEYTAKCPQLSNPPASVLKALEDVRRDPEGRAWVIRLSQHLDKLKVCK